MRAAISGIKDKQRQAGIQTVSTAISQMATGVRDTSFCNMLYDTLLNAISAVGGKPPTYAHRNIESNISSEQDPAEKVKKSESYIATVESIRETVDGKIPPPSDSILDEFVKRYSSGKDKGDEILGLITQLGFDPSRKTFFSTSLVSLVSKIRNGASSQDIDGAFKKIEQIATADISDKAKTDAAAAMNEANAFSTLTQKTLDFIADKKIPGSAISKKVFDDLAKQYTAAASQQATQGQPGSQVGQSQIDIVKTSLDAGFTKYATDLFSNSVSPLASKYGVDVSDFNSFIGNAKVAMINAFHKSFDSIAYEKYAKTKASKTKSGKQKVYSPVNEATSIGRASAAYAIGCYLTAKASKNDALKSSLSQSPGDYVKVAKKVFQASPVVGVTYGAAYKNLDGTSIDPEHTRAFGEKVGGSNLDHATREFMFTTFYAKFRKQFESKYNPGGIISTVFRKFPDVRSPFLNAPDMVARIWVEIHRLMETNKSSVTADQKQFYHMYFVRKGNPLPTLGMAESGFVDTIVRAEEEALGKHVDKMVIDPAKTNKDPTANDAIVISKQRAAEETVNRLVKHVLAVAENALVEMESPPVKTTSSRSRVVRMATDGQGFHQPTQDLPGSEVPTAASVTITKPEDLPRIPEIPRGISDLMVKENGEKPDEKPGEEAIFDVRGEGVSRGSVFYAFCCGILTANKLAVETTAPKEEGLKLNPEQGLRLNPEEEKAPTANQATQAAQ